MALSVKEKIEHRLSEVKNKKNKKIVKEYALIRKRIDGISDSTIERNLNALLALSRFLGDRDFIDVTREDMMEFEEYMENEYQSNSKHKTVGVSKLTLKNYEASIKRFYKYLYNKEEYTRGKEFQKPLKYPKCVSWISVNTANKTPYPIDKILSEDEILKLISACTSDRDRAMVATALYDAGLRLGEACALNIRNVEFDKVSPAFTLPVDGNNMKTGPRKVRLFLVPSSAKYLKDYLKNHPYKQYDAAPLFYTFHHHKLSQMNRLIRAKEPTAKDFELIRMTTGGFASAFRRIVRSAGLSGITPHTLRHNSATKCAQRDEFNETLLRIRFGWAQNSNMPTKYVHLANKDMENVVKRITGFKEPEVPEPSKLVTKICWNCDAENTPTDVFCSRCGAKLNSKPENAITARELGLDAQEILNGDDEMSDEMLVIMINHLAKKLDRSEKEQKKS